MTAVLPVSFLGNTDNASFDGPSSSDFEPDQAAALSKELFWLFWSGITSSCIRLMSPSVYTVNSTEISVATGTREVAGALQRLRTKLPNTLLIDSESYHATKLSEDTFIVLVQQDISAWSTTIRDQAAQQFPPLKVIATLLWKRPSTGEEPRLAMGHYSYALVRDWNETGEVLVRHDKQNYSVVASQNEQSENNSGKIVLQAHDVMGNTHWIAPENIIYVKAEHQYTDVHCRDRLLRLRASFTSILDQLGSTVVRVHRSYAINPTYISRMEQNTIYLTTGDEIPVPVKRVREVRGILQTQFSHLGVRA